MGLTPQPEIRSIQPAEGAPMRMGQAFLVIDPAALAGSEVYFERLETLVAATLDDGGVRLPGDRRHALAARAAKEGIEIPAALEKHMRELARR